MTDVRILASGLGFPEGPVAMADGSVVLTEINGGWVTRVGADGTVTRLESRFNDWMDANARVRDK